MVEVECNGLAPLAGQKLFEYSLYVREHYSSNSIWWRQNATVQLHRLVDLVEIFFIQTIRKTLIIAFQLYNMLHFSSTTFQLDSPIKALPHDRATLQNIEGIIYLARYSWEHGSSINSLIFLGLLKSFDVPWPFLASMLRCTTCLKIT